VYDEQPDGNLVKDRQWHLTNLIIEAEHSGRGPNLGVTA